MEVNEEGSKRIETVIFFAPFRANHVWCERVGVHSKRGTWPWIDGRSKLASNKVQIIAKRNIKLGKLVIVSENPSLVVAQQSMPVVVCLESKSVRWSLAARFLRREHPLASASRLLQHKTPWLLWRCTWRYPTQTNKQTN